jgi:hypothetical protein
MTIEDDEIYYAERERTERCLAANATDEAAKAIHIEMAAKYRQLTIAARNRAKLPEFMAQPSANRA